MNQILTLREKRANLWNETKAFLDSHRGEDGMVSAEDNATYEKMEADVVALGKEIERLERQAAIDRELDQPTASPLVSDSIVFGSSPSSKCTTSSASKLCCASSSCTLTSTVCPSSGCTGFPSAPRIVMSNSRAKV